MKENRDRIDRAKSLPYFLRDNTKFKVIRKALTVEYGIEKIRVNIAKANSTSAKPLFVAFEPFSPIIINQLGKLRTSKEKQRLLKEVTTDESFGLLDLGLQQGGVTRKHRLHKTGKGWADTKGMARDINRRGVDVCFLPEYDEITSADAITSINGKLCIVDFKFSTTTSVGTLKKDLQKGFEQAGNIVLKFTKGSRRVFEETIDEMVRKERLLGDIKLINRQGKVKDLSAKKLLSGKYKKELKGFL